MKRIRVVGLAAAFYGVMFLAACGEEPAAEGSAASPEEVFQQRIMPIFRSPQPASCVQCHLSSVDLKDYILPSHEKTFVSLRDQGLIDLDRPEQSKILKLIRMGEQDLDEGARLIHAKTRDAEYAAFAAWIKACCRDPVLRNLPALPEAERARPARPDPVIRHARKSRVVDSFVRNIWSQRMRCFPCHTPYELDESNPKTRGAIQKHKEFMAKYGPELGDRMNIFLETPEATLQSLIDKSRRAPKGTLPLLNLDDPARSLLILKPTSKVPPKDASGEFVKPTYAEPVTHMGGLKMHVNDPSYKAFIAWIEDYARVVKNQYTSVADLPADNWYPTEQFLMVRDVPSSWTEETPVQITVHAWNAETQSWSSDPVAFTQGVVAPSRNVVGTLFLLGQPPSVESELPASKPAPLGRGKYLLKAFVDTHQRLSKDPTLLLGDEDFYGQAVVEARWSEGFPRAEKVLGSDFKQSRPRLR